MYHTLAGAFDAIAHAMERYFTNTAFVDFGDRMAEAATAYDDMGSTAMDVIDTILADSDEPMLLTRWMRIQNEE